MEAVQDVESKLLELEITEDKMQAYLVVNEFENNTENSISKQDVINLIEDNGLKYGVNDDAIMVIINKETCKKKTLIAEGTPPIDGKDANLIFHFPTECSSKPKLTDDGHLDYKEINLVHSVEKDTILVEKEALTPGINGMNIFKDELKAVDGKDVEITLGDGTYKDSESGFVIRAKTDGVVFFSSKTNKIEVKDIYLVKGSVDYSTGNIHVNCSVVINGNVNPGFAISTPNNIEIKGVVDQAEIYCAGTLKVKAGIRGNESQKIVVGADVHVCYINDQQLTAEGSIYVGSEIRNSDLESNDEVALIKIDGVILGGKTSATNKISAPFIGNSYNIPTYLEVGVNNQFKKRFNEINEEISNQNILLKQIKIDIACASKISFKKLRLRKLIAIKKEWNKCITKYEKLKSELAEIEKEYFCSPDPMVCVSKTVFPGTTIKIKNKTYEVKEELSHVKFRIYEGEIVYEKL